MKKNKKRLLWIGVIIAITSIIAIQRSGQPDLPEVNYSEFKSIVDKKELDVINISPSYTNSNKIVFSKTESKDKPEEQKKYYATYVPSFSNFWDKFEDSPKAKDVTVSLKPIPQDGFFLSLIKMMIPMVLIIGLFMLLQRFSMGMLTKGGKAQRINPDNIDVSFDDVIGIDEIKAEVTEIIEFLKNPKEFDKAGAKMPRGIILSGSPGVGKTMLAKSLAKEAKVPFFFCSGSSFVEMFVGLGASRVRTLFDEAKAAAPCIIFIDEIDTVGAKRGNGNYGVDERDSTLNELLTQMDGMASNNGVFIMGATNRVDMLDNALKRPGRFDRQLVVPMPNVESREELLRKLSKKYHIADDVDMQQVAKSLTGLSPAEITNMMNEAAILQVRKKKDALDRECIDEAHEKILLGLGNGHKMNEKDKRITAYHEAGHAIVGLFNKECDPVHKISITPRGQALGVTVSRPEEDRVHYSKKYLLAQIAMLYGGFCAEKMFIGDNTTGASSDIQRATEIAKKMVTVYGLSSLQQYVFLGIDGMGRENLDMFSEEMKRKIEAEIMRILEECQKETNRLLKENRDVVEKIVAVLLEKENINETDIKDILIEMKRELPDYLK